MWYVLHRNVGAILRFERFVITNKLAPETSAVRRSLRGEYTTMKPYIPNQNNLLADGETLFFKIILPGPTIRLNKVYTLLVRSHTRHLGDFRCDAFGDFKFSFT